MKFYTYLHRRNDTNAIFYIGKGKDNRAWITKRNKFWHSIADSRGFTVEICAYWPTEQEAHTHEKFLILCFKDLDTNLVNQTDGGEGTAGMTPWNKGLKGHPNKGGVRKGEKRPGIGGVKQGNIPWNKGISYPSGKKGKQHKNPRTADAIYKSIFTRFGQQAADNFLIKRSRKHPDTLGQV